METTAIRNPEIPEALLHFDRLRAEALAEDRDADPWAALSTEEREWVRGEIGKCAADFRYAAYNYFWISGKDSKLKLFSLWESQELILDVVLWMWAQGRPAWIMVHKARQLGMSTFVEALMAWKTLFFENIVAMIVADNPGQSSYLFNIMLRIYDHMPWVMRPMQQARERKEIILLDNPDENLRRIDPGLNNWLIAHAANKLTSVGQGKPLHAVHLSEVSSWVPEKKAQEIIEGDILRALVELPSNFCIMESTPKGIGDYWHDCWNAFVVDGREAQFFPLFLPAFFENTRRRKPAPNFVLTEEEVRMKERYAEEWHKCDACGKPIYANWAADSECFGCGGTTSSPVWLEDEQISWYRFHRDAARKRGREQYKLFLQEMAVTAEEGFQHAGYQVFPDDCVDWVRNTAKPGLKGKFDEQLIYHPDRKLCPICQQDHSIDDDNDYEVWELPLENATYVVGADSAEGLDDGDWLVATVLKINQGTNPDTQVCQYRAHTDAISFGRICYILGKAYNTAMLAIEARGAGESTQWEAMYKMNYPNIFNWLVLDHLGNPRTKKAGWWTNERTRQQMITTGIRWLRGRIWKVQSLEFLHEMPYFVKDDWAAQGRAMRGKHDDVIMANLIAIHCLPEGSLVRTVSGMKSIEQIVPGELVLTHQGRFRPVLETQNRYEPERLFKIKAYGRPPLLVTGDHPLLLWDRKRVSCEPKPPAFDATKGSWKNHPAGKKVCKWKYSDTPTWIAPEATDHLTKYATGSTSPTEIRDREFIDLTETLPSNYKVVDGKAVAFFRRMRGEVGNQNKIEVRIPLRRSMLRLLGYYLAEGSTSLNSVQFASHEIEAPIRMWVKEYLKSLGLNSQSKRVSRHGFTLWCSSLPLRSFFSQFGHGCQKKLPWWTTLLPPAKCREIVIGYLLGDGCFRGKAGGVLSSTISLQAGFQLFELCMRSGWSPSLQPRVSRRGDQTCWTLQMSGWSAENIRALIEPKILACKRPKLRTRKFSTDFVKKVGEKLVGKIRSVEIMPFSGTVYDLSVEEDHSFVANGTIVHNCAHIDDLDPATGRIMIPTGRLAAREQSGLVWTCVCVCGNTWDSSDPRGEVCHKCAAARAGQGEAPRLAVSATRKDNPQVTKTDRRSALALVNGLIPAAPTGTLVTPDFDCL